MQAPQDVAALFGVPRFALLNDGRSLFLQSVEENH